MRGLAFAPGSPTPGPVAPLGRPLQIGLLLDFPPFVAPATIGVGVLLLTVWFVADRLLPALGLDADIASETVLVATLVVGLFATALGTAASTDSLWAVALLLFLVGRGVEGAVFVHLVRKLAHYVGGAVGWFRAAIARATGGDRPGRSSRGGVRTAARSLLEKYVRKLLYRLVALGFLLTAVAMTVVLSTLVLDFGGYTVPQVYAVVVGTSALFTFAWDVRPALDRLGPLPFAGVICCVVGAEVYNFPTAGVAPATVTDLLRTVGRLVGVPYLGVTDVPTELIVAAVGFGAYALGAGYAALAVAVNDRSASSGAR
ncbi:MAG: hypothetical protein ABEJ26_10070 [Halosimplex sp.]